MGRGHGDGVPHEIHPCFFSPLEGSYAGWGGKDQGVLLDPLPYLYFGASGLLGPSNALGGGEVRCPPQSYPPSQLHVIFLYIF